MPNLNFLKKKRTKDSGSKDFDSPTSPINPGASPFSPVKSNTRGSVVSKSSTNQDQQASHSAQPTATTPTSHKPADSMNPSTYPQQAYATPQASPEPQQTPQTVPSIQNLIHPANSTAAGYTQPSQQQQQQQQSQSQQQPNASSSRTSNGGQAQAQPTPTVRTTKGKYTLQDFTLQRTLGTGSFGRVHLVQSKHNQRFYAVKVLKKAQVVKMKQVEHTNDERRMLQQVKHPFLITLWGTFQDSKNLYMVMDFVEGGELFSLLRKSQVSSAIPSRTFQH
jgi:protein kinase A